MKRLWIVSAGCMFFFGGAVAAQDNLEIRLKSCPEVTAPNDPSIVIKKTVQISQKCTDTPLEITVTDTRFGFAAAPKTIGNISTKPWRVELSENNVFATHKPCRRLFPQKGVMIEWLIPRDQDCTGRSAAWYHRVYTREKLCIMPGEQCIAIADSSVLSQQRFAESVKIAYQK